MAHTSTRDRPIDRAAQGDRFDGPMPRWRACAPRTNSPPQPEADTLVELRPALAKLAPLVHELKQRAELDVERATAAEAAAAADASKSAQLREQVAQAAADLGAKQAALERERGARGDVDAHTHELAGELKRLARSVWFD